MTHSEIVQDVISRTLFFKKLYYVFKKLYEVYQSKIIFHNLKK